MARVVANGGAVISADCAAVGTYAMAVLNAPVAAATEVALAPTGADAGLVRVAALLGLAPREDDERNESRRARQNSRSPTHDSRGYPNAER